MASRISVIIPHLNQPQALARCLESLALGMRLADEIFVIDNGSNDLPRTTCEAFPNVRLLQELTPGPGPARNCGVAQASGDLVAFIDADCLADKDWLAAAERAMADPTAKILGGDVRIALVDPARMSMLEAYESIFAYRMDRYIAREGFTGTGNLVVRREVLREIGPFGGLAIAEDRDWGQRATKAGHRIRFEAGMKVFHPARERFSDLALKWDRQMAHDYVAASARPSGKLGWIGKTLLMGPSSLVELPGILGSDRIVGLRAKALAFACLARVRLYRMRRMAWLAAGGDPLKLSGAWNRKPN